MPYTTIKYDTEDPRYKTILELAKILSKKRGTKVSAADAVGEAAKRMLEEEK